MHDIAINPQILSWDYTKFAIDLFSGFYEVNPNFVISSVIMS